MIFAFSFKKKSTSKFLFAFKNDDFLQKRPKIIFFLPKKEHFSFKSVISMIWEIFWCILVVCRTKIGDFENSSHNSHTRDPRQPRGCSWGDYATQGADQGLKLKLGTLSNWGIWVLEVLTSHSTDTRGGTTRYPPSWSPPKKRPALIGLMAYLDPASNPRSKPQRLCATSCKSSTPDKLKTFRTIFGISCKYLTKNYLHEITLFVLFWRGI